MQIPTLTKKERKFLSYNYQTLIDRAALLSRYLDFF